MGTANDDGVNVHPFNARVADYGPLFYDRTHMLVFNYVYNLPELVRSKNAIGKVGGAIANNWQISGITTFMTGQPDNLSFSISGIGNLTSVIRGRRTWSADRDEQSPSYPKDIYQWMTPAGLALPPVKGSAGFDSSAMLDPAAWRCGLGSLDFQELPAAEGGHAAAIASGDVQRLQPSALQRFQP